VFECKATTKGAWSALRSPKVREQIKRLNLFAETGGLLPVVAIYWAQLDEFRLYSPERVLKGIVRPGDADLEMPDADSTPNDGAAESVPSPELSSPSVGFPRLEAEASREIRDAAREG
jgi:hypothetical protein